MILHILRAFFILLMAAVGLSFVYDDSRTASGATIEAWILPAASISIGVLLLCIDILSPRRKLAIFAGTFFGLVVGLLIAYMLSFIVSMVVLQYGQGDQKQLILYINTIISV